MQKVFAPLFIYFLNLMLEGNLLTTDLSRDILYELLRWFEFQSESVKLWINFSKNHSGSSKDFLVFGSDTIEKHRIIYPISYSSKGYAFVFLSPSKVTFLEEGEACIVKEVVVKFFCLLYCRRYFHETSNFSAFHFFHYCVTFFLHKLSQCDV